MFQSPRVQKKHQRGRQPSPPIAAQLWALFACCGERGCHCLGRWRSSFSTLPQGVLTTPPGHHCSSPDSSSGVLPRCCKHLSRPSKSQNENGFRCWLQWVSMRAETGKKTSLKPETESPEQHHVTQSLRASTDIVSHHSSPMPVLQGLSRRCGHIPYTPLGSLDAGKGYQEQPHLSRGQGEVGAGLGWL